MIPVHLPRILRLAALLLGLVVVIAASPPASAASAAVSDMEDDAYRLPDTPVGQPEPRPPVPILSNDSADVVMATYETAPPQQPGDQGAYKVSVTVAGQPHASYNYIVGAQFGADCWIFHYLTAGETRRALTSCGEGDSRRSVGTIAGSRVAIDGSTIFATFSFRRFLLPAPLKKDPVFGPLFVLTCPVTGKEWACDDNVLDFAYSENTFEF